MNNFLIMLLGIGLLCAGLINKDQSHRIDKLEKAVKEYCNNKNK
jgi:hypothetical protein